VSMWAFTGGLQRSHWALDGVLKPLLEMNPYIRHAVQIHKSRQLDNGSPSAAAWQLIHSLQQSDIPKHSFFYGTFNQMTFNDLTSWSS
jgi:hypothetical protein